MSTIHRLAFFITFLIFVISIIGGPQARSKTKTGAQPSRLPSSQAGTLALQSELTKKIRRFAPTIMSANTARLSVKDRQALQKIIAAAKLYDRLYLRQIWSGNEGLLQKLQADKTALGRLRLHYFMINKGPWSQLDENEPFIEGVPKRPPQANFYPEDMTKDEFNAWVTTLSAAEKEKATGYFYTIRRDAGGKLRTVPYNEEYREFLEPAAKLLREAAA